MEFPIIWFFLWSVLWLVYFALDGFDLGVGILIRFLPSNEKEKRTIISSIGPFWDGNETWLVLGGAGLFVAFPLAYSVLMPAFYMPIIVMLLALVFRGVAFEFRFKAEGKSRRIWDYAFHFGSLIATFAQGMMLGTLVQGIEVNGRHFSGSPIGWLTAFSMMTGIALVFGYALLGATWLVMKTEHETHEWARKCSSYVLLYVLAFMGMVSLWVPFLHEGIFQRWFSLPNLFFLSPVPVLVIGAAWYL
ncbi:MAG: cytochrome d ubiquinol oxidase subunit II, partial [Burkholderiales bacterium]